MTAMGIDVAMNVGAKTTVEIDRANSRADRSAYACGEIRIYHNTNSKGTESAETKARRTSLDELWRITWQGEQGKPVMGRIVVSCEVPRGSSLHTSCCSCNGLHLS